MVRNPRDIDSIRAMLDRGGRMFPVTMDKIPCFKGWQEAATNDLRALRDQVGGAGHRYGGLATRTGLGLSVLDIDGPFGFDALEDLASEDDEVLILPDHLVGRTPRGGYHLWYRSPEGDLDRNRTHMLDLPIDWRGKGGLAVTHGPGRSLTGHVVPEPPQWLLRLLERQSGFSGVTDDDTVAKAKRPLTADRYQSLLSTISGAPEGKRNELLWWGARKVWTGWLCTPDRPPARDVAADLEASGRQAGLDEAESARTVRSALDRAKIDVQ